MLKSGYLSGTEFDAAVSITNTPKKFTVNVTKRDDSGNTVSGVAFGLYTTEPIYLEGDNKDLPAGSLVSYGKTDSDGKLTLGENLPATQDYILKEISTVSTLELAIGSISVDGTDMTSSVTDNSITLSLGEFKSNSDETKTFNVSVMNKAKEAKADTYKLTVQKTDESGNPLSGARIGLIYNGEFPEEDSVITTGSDGKAVFTVNSDAYTVHEVSAPFGYKTADDIPVYITGDTTVTMTDEKYPVPERGVFNLELAKTIIGKTDETRSFAITVSCERTDAASEDEKNSTSTDVVLNSPSYSSEYTVSYSTGS